MLRFSSPWNVVDFGAPLFASCWVGIGLSHDDTSLVLVHVIEIKISQRSPRNNIKMHIGSGSTILTDSGVATEVGESV